MTKTTFPGLQKLHISIEGELRHLSRSSDSLTQVETLILKPIEEMIIELPKLEMLEVALPLSLYDLSRFKVRGSYVEPGYGVHDDERLWTELRTSSTSDESASGLLSGYWVCNPQSQSGIEEVNQGLADLLWSARSPTCQCHGKFTLTESISA
jgi:hypothetical protein